VRTYNNKDNTVHPIHYSLIFNIIALAVCGVLAWEFSQPWLVVIALMLAQHSMARFQDEGDDDDDDDSQPMGFTADIK
jgi:hypothetical protein